MKEGHRSKTGLGGSATEVNSGESQLCRGRDEEWVLHGDRTRAGAYRNSQSGSGQSADPGIEQGFHDISRK